MKKDLLTQLTQALLVLGFSNFSGPALAAFAAGIVAAMTGNAYYPNPVPAIADLQALLTDYNTAAQPQPKAATAMRWKQSCSHALP